jgi:hypothetical protein
LKKLWNKIFGFLFFTEKQTKEIQSLFGDVKGLIGRMETQANTETRRVLFEKYEPHKWAQKVPVGGLG